MSAKDKCEDLVQEISELVRKLHSDIPLATQDGRIWAIMTGPLRDSNWETFNHRFDCLYGEDMRDTHTGRLPNIERGKYGLDAVVNYLRIAVSQSNMLHKPMMIKLDRLHSELQKITYVCVFL